MKKRDETKQEHKIILFPNLEKRLLEKGLDLIQRKNFAEAITLLNQASQLNPDDEDINLGLVVANFEAGNLAEANQRAKRMLQLGIGEYFTIVDMYIMILVQQKKYAEIVTTIEVLLQEREVPADKMEHFMKMLHFSRKMSESITDSYVPEHTNPFKELTFDLFSIKDPGEQVQLAGRLASSNIKVYIPEISEFLSSDEGDPFFKTILLTVLKEQDYHEKIIVKKYNNEITIIPKEIFEVHSHPDLLASLKIVTKNLEDDDPILLDSIKQLMERYFFLKYPFRTEFGNPSMYGAAFHFVALSYFGQEQEVLNIADLYGVEEALVIEAVHQISSVDEISLP